MGGPSEVGPKAVRVTLRDRNGNPLLVVHQQRGGHVVDREVLVNPLLGGSTGERMKERQSSRAQAAKCGDGGTVGTPSIYIGS